MKNILLLLAGFTFCFFMFSCNRSHSCTCNYNTNDSTMAADHVEISGSKNHAFHECCTIRKAQHEAQGYTNVLCVVPI